MSVVQDCGFEVYIILYILCKIYIYDIIFVLVIYYNRKNN